MQKQRQQQGQTTINQRAAAIAAGRLSGYRGSNGDSGSGGSSNGGDGSANSGQGSANSGQGGGRCGGRRFHIDTNVGFLHFWWQKSNDLASVYL